VSTIAAVIVTYNRLSLLKECVEAIRNQSRKTDAILVINNGSTDGTEEWLNSQDDVITVTQDNAGGAGGFSRGIKEAYNRGYDWFWCMDDDTIPTTSSLERLTAVRYFDDAQTGFLASMVVWTDGKPHPWVKDIDVLPLHTWWPSVLEDHCVRASWSAFLSVLINRDAVKGVGLPIKQFFIHYDDYEYTSRISALFRNNFFVLDSIVLHKTKNPQGEYDVFGTDKMKYCYGVRNKTATSLLRLPGLISKAKRSIRLMLFLMIDVAKRKRPLIGIWWLIKGVMMRIKIEMVEN
jgi:hypothetical protein